MSVEDRFLQSHVTGDLSGARSSLADNSIVIYENGDERTRDAFIGDLERNSYWSGLTSHDRVIHIYDDAAVTHAILMIKLGGGQSDIVRTTGVYAKQAGAWRIVSWQTTPLGDAAKALSPH
ncbi:nuclear transport factor 2 family protein [Sphingomonas sp. BIUV-7]|uniref:Nuclear transport factor 2 family protein n=1 Tax=Sphingomonas natans TaxID=3063330 RepID=A0ABT8YA98_9SPHN|nr:nuclear transport factor 2 family protein [Sphingomonas sp. BIUV-7]MDO6415263.1 nuclear transport factor 2 family protein [Sphingomonas sp. BIUV-7]